MRAADIPNAICVLRILLVAPTVLALLGGRYPLAFVLVLVAGFSDALDGFLAKRFDWRSRLGGLLDPLADKLLLMSLFVTLAWLGHLPAWLAGVVIGRDLVIVAGGLAYHVLVGPVQPEPSRASKLNTGAQLACVAVVLAGQLSATPLAMAVTAAGAAVLVTSVVSGLDYVIRWTGRALAGRA
ncbi:MAG: CDP-alcohol phosphatidyltransferase family protein [Gammaproteobacteria bacterium]|nr:CDP-alcohol phosphatidyltransferase family protein [Gammaproteobacteria bacterium]